MEYIKRRRASENRGSAHSLKMEEIWQKRSNLMNFFECRAGQILNELKSILFDLLNA